MYILTDSAFTVMQTFDVKWLDYILLAVSVICVPC